GSWPTTSTTGEAANAPRRSSDGGKGSRKKNEHFCSTSRARRFSPRVRIVRRLSTNRRPVHCTSLRVLSLACTARASSVVASEHSHGIGRFTRSFARWQPRQRL